MILNSAVISILVRRHGPSITKALSRAGLTAGCEVSKEQLRAITQPKRGLGDLVASIAQPIARTIDRALGTTIANCGGCRKRKEMLNRLSDRLRP